MTIRFGHVLALLAVELCLSIGSTVRVEGEEIRFNPVWGSDHVICLPGEPPCGATEIILGGGGVEVTLFVEVSAWDPGQYGEPTLGGYHATLDLDTLKGGHASGDNTLADVDIVPFGYPDDWALGAFRATRICVEHPFRCVGFECNLTDPVTFLSDCGSNAGSTACPPSHILCIERPLCLFCGSLDCPPDIPSTEPRYEWGCTSTDCMEDPDALTWFYGGTLVVDVPIGALGTYNVNFLADPSMTSLSNCWGGQIPRPWRTAGQITIVEDVACCMGDGTCVLLLEDQCVASGGSFFATSCDVDTDDDGVFDICDPCPIDNPDDSDGDGACDSEDVCPADPNKASPGQCGCGNSDNDSDGDGIADCLDECPGLDDALYTPECIDAIPTVSTWGLVVLSLLLLVGGKIHFGRLRPYGAAEYTEMTL